MRQFYVWSSSKPLRLGPSAQREDAFSPLFGGITPDPNIELSSLSLDAGLTLITPEVPLWLAEVAAKVALPLLGSEKAGWQKRWRWLLCKIASERVRMAISAWDQQYTKPMGSLVSAASTLQPAQSCRTVAAQPVTTSEPGSTVLKILITRRLMEDEVRQALSQSEVGQLGTLRSSIHALVLAGYVQRESSVGVNWFGRLQCRRCGAEEIELTWCVRCGRECPVCRECRNMGMSRGCTPLYSLTDIGRRVAADILRTKCVPKVNLSFELSVAQKTAARQVEEALVSGAKDILVWAACGAGKTEVVYGAIRNTLAKSQRVLLVTPRRDVSAELCQRLRESWALNMYLVYMVALSKCTRKLQLWWPQHIKPYG